MKKITMIVIAFFSFFLLNNDAVAAKSEKKELIENNSKIRYSIDESFWERIYSNDDLTEFEQLITDSSAKHKWKSSCGYLVYIENDMYDADDNLERYELDDSIVTEEGKQTFKDEYTQNSHLLFPSVDVVKYKMNFYKVSGTIVIPQEYDYDNNAIIQYVTMNNGYQIIFNYYYNGSEGCEKKVNEIISNINETNKSSDFDWLALILRVIITAISYLFIPLLILIITKDNISQKNRKIISIANSVIIGGIWLLFTVDSGYKWTPLPAFFYYFINSALILRYKGESNQSAIIKCPNCGSVCYEGDNYCRHCRTKLNNSKEEYKCQNCGATINPYDKECPNCGEAVEIIYKYSEEEIAKIYQEAEKNRINGNVDVAQKLYMKYIEVTESSMKEEGKKCYTFNNNIEFAIAAYKKELEKECININYNTSSAYFYLSYFAIDRKEYEEARKFLDLSLSYNPYNVASIFEKAELYKIEGNFKKYLELTKNSYEKIYYIKDLAHYYRNLGYYYTEKEKWELAKATYLYSLKYENSPNVEAELKYISSKSKDESLPKKEELTTILRENEIPTFISKDNLQIIKSIHNDLEKNNQLGSALGKFVSNLMKENSNS